MLESFFFSRFRLVCGSDEEAFALCRRRGATAHAAGGGRELARTERQDARHASVPVPTEALGPETRNERNENDAKRWPGDARASTRRSRELSAPDGVNDVRTTPVVARA